MVIFSFFAGLLMGLGIYAAISERPLKQAHLDSLYKLIRRDQVALTRFLRDEIRALKKSETPAPPQ